MRACVRKLAPFPTVVSQTVTNKGCLVCVMSEKYACWVTLRAQSDCCGRGEAKVRILDFKTTWSEFQKPSQTAAVRGKAELRIYNRGYFQVIDIFNNQPIIYIIYY